MSGGSVGRGGDGRDDDPHLDEAELSAYHEAGHALVAIYLGGQVHSLTIAPDRDDGPDRHGDAQVVWNPRRLSERRIRENSVLVALAGPVAERIHRGEPLHPGFVPEWMADWRLAWEAAETLVPEPRLRVKYLERVTDQLDELLRRDAMWAALAALVDELATHETLESSEIHDIVSQWL